MAEQPCAAPAAQEVQDAADVSKLQVPCIRHQLQPTASSSNAPEAAPVAGGIGGSVARANAPGSCSAAQEDIACRVQAMGVVPVSGGIEGPIRPAPAVQHKQTHAAQTDVAGVKQ
jgi:hypothetical protein